MQPLGLAVLVGLMLMSAQNAPALSEPAALVLIQAEDLVPLAAVLEVIAERFPGRALDAKKVERGKHMTYRIKWLGEDGKVRAVIADARTGEILRVR